MTFCIKKIMTKHAIFLIIVLFFTASCEAQTEQQALEQLRLLTKDGNLPQESVVQSIESRFGNSKTGALAKILRARIRLQNNDGSGAADILNSTVFKQKTNVADYALWLRGKSLMQAGRFAEAISVFQQLINEFPNSLRLREAKFLWAESALNANQNQTVQSVLQEFLVQNDARALLLLAKSFETSGNQADAIKQYRKLYFLGAGTDEAKEAETKLTAFGQILTPNTQEEASIRFEKLVNTKNFVEAEKLVNSFPMSFTPKQNLQRISMYSGLKKMQDAANAFNAIPLNAEEKGLGYQQLAVGYGNARLWTNARQIADEMRRTFPLHPLTPKTFIQLGLSARDAKNKVDENYFLQTAVNSFPNSLDVVQAQFELAWTTHDSKNFALSSQMLTEHLARYVDKDTTYRGRAGYWAARDSERAGKIAEACSLYDGVMKRYEAGWYGILSAQRITAMRSQGKCQTVTPPNQQIAKAVANLQIITVAAETSTAKEQERIAKGEDLGLIGLFDWAIDEFLEAQKTSKNSPKVNIALAKLYRLKFDQASAVNTLAKSYPDFSQMKPEELTREEWDIVFPLRYWDSIAKWANARGLDKYQVAGLIRQESIFDPRVKSHANAYGLMQMLLPTARSTAKKYGSTYPNSAEDLYQPELNIELGTGYMKDQFNKFGRIEFVAVAYNAGPLRVPQWRASLPAEMDEFVEAIPYKETRGYVQGVVRNTAQYRRLYDENGQFRANVGTKPLRNVVDTQTRQRIAEEFPDVRIDDGNSADE
jgi:soluble lytic murein transglycosylase